MRLGPFRIRFLKSTDELVFARNSSICLVYEHARLLRNYNETRTSVKQLQCTDEHMETVDVCTRGTSQFLKEQAKKTQTHRNTSLETSLLLCGGLGTGLCSGLGVCGLLLNELGVDILACLQH
jgi:hypothetical protein